jgi:serine/threonine-protein kinase
MSSAPAYKPGDVFQQYRVERMLGAGLHGEVYLVEHVYTHDRFALKVMHLEDAREAHRVRRALSTALATYRIQHANVVTVHNLGCEEDGTVWILMEYLDGGSIGELLARQRGRMSRRLALHVAIEAAWGLDAAHELQIIHRDVKPEHVWLTSDGRIKIIDLSLAKVIPDGIQTTQRRAAFGTAPYMAPEALKGADPDARVDVYGLGLMLWQMLGGRHPFPDALRDTTEMVRRQLYVMPELLSVVAGLPAYVDDFMRRAIAKDPGERFLTIAQMAQAMMALRERLGHDAEAGLLVDEVPPGEPRFPSAPGVGRAYHGAHSVIEATPAPVMPPARVDVSHPQPRLAGPGGTIPLGAAHFALPLPSPAVTALLPAPRPAAAALPPEPTPRAPRPASEARPPEPTPRPAPPRVPVAAARRGGLLLALALVSALTASVGVLAWRRARVAAAAPRPPSSVATAPAGVAPPEVPPAASPGEPAPSGEESPSSTKPAPGTSAAPIAQPPVTRHPHPTPSAPPASASPVAAPSPPPPAPKPPSNRLFGAEP